MPNTKSARKMVRVSRRRQIANKPVRSVVKTYMTKASRLIRSGELDAAREAVAQSVSVLDKAARKGVIHPNNAARHKSRLMSKLNSAQAITSAEEKPKSSPGRKKTSPPN